MRLLVDPLEPRRLCYAFSLTNGVLILAGDPTSQDLTVSVVGTRIQANLVEGGVQKKLQQWSLKSVKQMLIVCDAGNDRVMITNKIKIAAVIDGNAGSDTIISGGGKDVISGGLGDDLLDGGSGADTIRSGGGNDTVDYSSRTNPLNINTDKAGGDGEAGENDSIAADIPRILGGSGNDTIRGTDNLNFKNYIHGGAGNDTLYGGEGDDTLNGSSGNDYLYGEGGRDFLRGETGKDRLFGGSSNDTLMGGKSNDQLFGEKGADRLYDRDNQIDTINGGPDSDSGEWDSIDNVFAMP